jgi:hypothetical protein
MVKRTLIAAAIWIAAAAVSAALLNFAYNAAAEHDANCAGTYSAEPSSDCYDPGQATN